MKQFIQWLVYLVVVLIFGYAVIAQINTRSREEYPVIRVREGRAAMCIGEDNSRNDEYGSFEGTFPVLSSGG